MAAYADRFINETTKAGLDPNTSFASKGKGICSYFKKLKTDDFSDDKCVNNTLKNALTVLKAGRPRLVQTGILLYH